MESGSVREVRVVVSDKVFANTLYVDTRGRLWRVALSVCSGEVVLLARKAESVRFLESVASVLRWLPVRLYLPERFALKALPRYYLISLVLRDEGESGQLKDVEVREIVGIRKDLTATKWGYRAGYWHPRCQHDIVAAIQREIRELKRALGLEAPEPEEVQLSKWSADALY